MIYFSTTNLVIQPFLTPLIEEVPKEKHSPITPADNAQTGHDMSSDKNPFAITHQDKPIPLLTKCGVPIDICEVCHLQ